jgi:hypothetical protein
VVERGVSQNREESERGIKEWMNSDMTRGWCSVKCEV